MIPAYVHLALNHIPVVGMAVGLLLLLAALKRDSDELKRVSLVVFVGVALVTVPVYLSGGRAEEVVEHLPGVSERIIEEHEEAAEVAAIGVAVLGVASLAGLLVSRGAGSLPQWLTIVCLGLSVVTSGLLARAANLGGQVRHTEIRADAHAPGAHSGKHSLKEKRDNAE